MRTRGRRWAERAPRRFRRLWGERLEDRAYLSLSVGDIVWNDLNADGVQTTGEPGVAGAVVEVFSSIDGVVGNADDVSRGVAMTDAGGNCTLTGLADGVKYYLVFRTPVGYSFTLQDQGGDDTLDSDADPATGRTAMFTLAAGDDRTDVNAGLVGAAPWFGFAAKAGAISGDHGPNVATDATGNVYVAGYFAGAVDFDAGPSVYKLTSTGVYDAFVVKYSPAGALLWARAIGGTGIDYAYGIAVDSGGSVYTTGSFQGTADFDPGVGTTNLTGAGSDDIFVSKLNAAGDFAWARALGGTGTDVAYGIAVDSGGSVYTTGSFQGTADFDPGPGTTNLTGAGYSDIFVSKLDASGNFVWACAMGGGGTDVAYGIAVDSGGNAYTTGSFSGTVDFDPGGGWTNLTSAGGADVFVSKLNAAGNFAWARKMGGTESDIAYGIAVDSGGSVYTTGCFGGTADFDPGTGTFNLTSAGVNDIFVSKVISSRSPTDLALWPVTLIEHQPAGTLVGQLTGSDPDPGETFTYSLVSGSGSSDNAFFSIGGNHLRTARPRARSR